MRGTGGPVREEGRLEGWRAGEGSGAAGSRGKAGGTLRRDGDPGSKWQTPSCEWKPSPQVRSPKRSGTSRVDQTLGFITRAQP